MNPPKHYKPNEKALPPLLDECAEENRLLSIEQEKVRESIQDVASSRMNKIIYDLRGKK